MDEVVKDVPPDQEIHVILDNYATHKKNGDWLKAHPNVAFSLHPDIRVVAQSDRNLVRHSRTQSLERRQLQQHTRAGSGHRRLLRSLARTRPPLRLEKARSARESNQRYYR